MEFKGKTIKGTERIPGYVFIADTADDTAPVNVPEVKDLYEDHLYEESEEARYAVFDVGLSSDADNIAVEFLLDKMMRTEYEVDDLFAHLSELNGEGLNVLDFEAAKKLVELAKERILQELSLGKFTLKIVSLEYLEKAEDYFGNIIEQGGVNAPMLIEKIEQLLLDMISDKYKQEINQIQTDSINYGKDTALTLARDRAFKGNYYTARSLLHTSHLTAIEFDRLIDDGIIQLPEESLSNA